MKKTTKITAYILAFVMIAGIFAGVPNAYLPVSAAIDPPVAGSIPISNRAELENIKNDLSGNYHLTADINLSGTEWEPIGDSANPFIGIFDGQGYAINNLYILASSNRNTAGLFGQISSAEIKNVYRRTA